METPQGEPEDPQLTSSAIQSAWHNLTHQLMTHSRDGHHEPSQSPEQMQAQGSSGQDAEGWTQQQQWRVSVPSGFQDSNLSPALPLLPASTQEDNTFTEYSLFQQSDNNFSLLRPNPDTSVASEGSQHLPGDDSSLSQHPLLQESALADEEQMSFGSLSQPSLSPADKNREEQPSGAEDTGGNVAGTSSSLELPPGKAGEDEASVLKKVSPGEHLPELLQDEAGPVLSSSSQTSSKLVVPQDGGGGGGGGHWAALSSAVLGSHMEPELSAASQTGVEGSNQGFLPESQAAPGVSTTPPPASGTIGPAGRLSTIHSDQSDQSGTGAALQPAHVQSGLDQEEMEEESSTSSQVHSLPTVSFKQKVDAWRASQGSANVSLFDTLALQGFSGVSPKQKAFDAVSDTLNGILSQKLSTLNLTPAAVHSTPVWRGEAVGSAPDDDEEEVKRGEEEQQQTGSAPGPLLSTHPSSESFMYPDQQEKAPTDPQGDAQQQQQQQQQPGPWAQPLARLTLDQFSDVSPDLDSSLSHSQGSHSSRAKLDTSAAASSILSLEVDNYAPYWTSTTSTPPPRVRPQEVNIEERIPMYLHNLGIDQSPATILNPFAPRGPIREPEFSPTDLLTIKGSVGTSTRSSQPSEGGSPQKGDFSRSSILSVESSVSIPVSQDNLGAAAQLDPSSQQDEDSYPSTVQTVLRQQRGGSLASSQNTIPPGDAFDSDLDESSSLVGSQSRAEKVAPPPAAASTTAAPPRTLSAEDILRSWPKKTSRLLDFSNTSSGPGGPGPGLSGSPSDAMLTSEKLTQTPLGEQESFPLSEHQQSEQSAENADQRPHDGAVGRSAGSPLPPPLPLSQSARRAEPEGCSAAPADTPILPPTVIQTPPTVEVEEEKESEEEQLPHDSPPSQPSHQDTDPAATMSDAGSESSLALRVAELLQKESPAVSSTSDTTQLEWSRAREWLRLKMSGQECEPLELDQEDRMRIEEIKRELLLLNPITDSTDTESSAPSTTNGLTHPAAVAPTDHTGEQSLSSDPSYLDLQLPAAPGPDVEAREGVSRPRTNPPAFSSITIATRRRTPSPDPSPSLRHPSSPVPELLHLGQLSGETTLGLDVSLMNQPTEAAAAAGLGSQPQTASVPLGNVAPPPVQVSVLPQPEVTRSPRPESPPTMGHISYAHLNLSPKAIVGHSLLPAGQPRHSSTLLSPDEGLGLSSPPEWSDLREPIRERVQPSSTMLQPLSDVQEGWGSSPITTFRPPSSAMSPRDAATTARLRNSPVPVLLPYKPQGSEELFYVPQTGSGLQSETTLESSHTDSDDAVPPPFSTDVLGRGDPTLDRGVSIRHSEGIYSKRQRTTGHQGPELTAAGRSSQMEPAWGQRSSSHASITTAPHPPRRHQDAERDTGVEGVGPLDQLWLRFCSEWRQEEPRLNANRGASLLERLERLSRLIGHGETTARSRREWRGQEASVEGPSGRLPASSQEWTRGLQPQEVAPPASGAPSESVSVMSGSVSSIDTTRLARVYGAERVRRLRTSTSIHKLHRTIQEQKEGKNKEVAAPPSDSQSEASDQVAADSDSSANTFTIQSHRRHPSTRKLVGMVSRGVQAGGLQLDWSSRTGGHTRDQRPPSSCSSSLAASERGGAEGRNPARRSQQRKRIFPKGVSWFISAEELRSEARKENRPAVGPAVGRSTTWFQPYSSTAPWREPLRQRQVPEDHSRHRHRPKGKTTPPAGAPVTLQEALRRNRPEFIYQSRQRLDRLALRCEHRQLQDVYSWELPRRPAGTVQAALRRAVPKTEMIQRSKQIYESLPEVQRRRADQQRKAQYEFYRLNARLYNKKITSRVLNRRTAWN